MDLPLADLLIDLLVGLLVDLLTDLFTGLLTDLLTDEDERETVVFRELVGTGTRYELVVLDWVLETDDDEDCRIKRPKTFERAVEVVDRTVGLETLLGKLTIFRLTTFLVGRTKFVFTRDGRTVICRR